MLLLSLVLVAAPAGASAQREIDIHADVGLPGAPDRFLVVRVSERRIEGCITSASRICTRTRAIDLGPAARAELHRLLAAIDAMPRCEPVGFAPGDPAFTLTIGSRVAMGHLPADPALVGLRTDEACEAEHALAWWIAERFGGR